MKSPLRICVLSAAVLAAGFVHAESAPRYRIDYLPSLGGSSTANSINDFGWVAGRSTIPTSGSLPNRRRAVLWRNRQITDLGTLGGPQSSVVWPVKNLRGIITGIAETNVVDAAGEDWSCAAFLSAGAPAAPRYQCLGFVWENGRMQPLPTFGGTHGFATGSNNLGQVVGWAETTVRDPVRCVLPQKFQFRAALWEPRKNRMRELVPLAGDSVSSATAINDRGQVVGISGICDDAVGKFSAIHAVLWENGQPRDLGTLGGNAWNTPMAINPQGDVVGFGNKQVTPNGELVSGAFLWTRKDGIRPLPELPGDAGSQANGLNLWRHAVGRSCVTSDLGDCKAVLWRGNRVYRLSDLIPGFPADGPALANAVDIDDFGRISGQAIDPVTGAGIGFVATPMY